MPSYSACDHVRPTGRAGLQATPTTTRRRLDPPLPLQSWHIVVGLVIVAGALSSIGSWPSLRPSIGNRGVGASLVDERSSSDDPLGPHSIIPEYDRTLKKVLFSLARRDTSLKLHHELLVRTPGYAQIVMLVERANLNAIEAELAGKAYRERVQLVAYDGEPHAAGTFYVLTPDRDKLLQINTEATYSGTRYGNLWAQDFFEVTTSQSGELTLLTSSVHKYFNAVGDSSNRKVIGDNAYLTHLRSLGLDVRGLPLAFKGGNVLVDDVAGRRIAFCGGDTLRTTRTVSRSLDNTDPTDSEIIRIIQSALNVHEVAILGRERTQPSKMYHLDQAMIPLPGGVVAVTRLVGENVAGLSTHPEIAEVRRFLAEMRSRLVARGYRLVDIETSLANVMAYQFYVNAIPYVDLQTNQRTVLMPVFDAARTDFDLELVDRNTAAFESLGFKVVHVPTLADELTGGIHCLVNVLE